MIDTFWTARMLFINFHQFCETLVKQYQIMVFLKIYQTEESLYFAVLFNTLILYERVILETK